MPTMPKYWSTLPKSAADNNHMFVFAGDIGTRVEAKVKGKWYVYYILIKMIIPVAPTHPYYST